MADEQPVRKSPRRVGADDDSRRVGVTDDKGPTVGAYTGDTTDESWRRQIPKIAPFDETTDPLTWIHHASLTLKWLPEEQRIMTAVRSFRGPRIAWTSSLDGLPETWTEFVQAFRVYFVDKGEDISDESRLIQRANSVTQWSQEELASLKQLVKQTGMSEERAIKTIVTNLSVTRFPRNQTAWVKSWEDLNTALKTIVSVTPIPEVMTATVNSHRNLPNSRPQKPGPNYECWRCHQWGVHWRSECPYPASGVDRRYTGRGAPQPPAHSQYQQPTQHQYQAPPQQYYQAPHQPYYQVPAQQHYQAPPQPYYYQAPPQQYYQSQPPYQPPSSQCYYQPPSQPHYSSPPQQTQPPPQSQPQAQAHHAQVAPTRTSVSEQMSPNGLSDRDETPQINSQFSCSRVDVLLNGHNFQAIVDTGANVVVISSIAAKKAKLKVWPCNVDVRTASGESTPVIGVAYSVPITLAETTCKFDCYVMQSNTYSMLLGTNALYEFGAIIDVLRRQLIINGTTIPLKIFVDNAPTALFTSTEAINLPAYSHATIGVSLSNPENLTGNQVYHLKTKDRSCINYGIVAAQGIFDNQNIPNAILVANVTGKPVHIPAKTTIATAHEQEPTSDSDMIIDENEAQVVLPDISEMSADTRAIIGPILGKFLHLFGPIALGTATHNVEHLLPLTDNIPFKIGPYRNSRYEDDAIWPELEELLKKHFIEKSTSQYASPLILVPKKDGKVRLCIDYRRLNAKTVKEIYPMPRIDETLDRLQGAKIFSSLDMKSGYHQVPVAEADRHKTAFITKYGLYQWTSMPFGLCNAPATFQRLMDAILQGLNWQCCLVYLDDVIIYSKDINEHAKHLEQVFAALSRANLRLNSAKCNFAKEELRYLGHLISAKGIQPDSTKTDPLNQIPNPKNVHDVRALLGMLGYYRRFIRNFATIAEPLTRLLKAEVPFKWGPEQEQAKATLLREMTSQPILAYPDFSKPFILQTDASDVGVGAVLSQMQNGREHPISYASETLDQTKRSYSATEKEAYAIHWAVNYFRPYIHGRRFQLQTDHKALEYIFEGKTKNQKLLRWALSIQEFDFEVVYRKGKENGNADGLSRLVVNTIEGPAYHFSKRRLYYGKRIVPQAEDRLKLIKEYHQATAHSGKEALLEMLAQTYYWSTMKEDVDQFKRACPICQSFRTAIPPRAPVPIEVTAPFDRVGIDLVGPMPITSRGNRYVVVATDYFTHYTEAVPIPEKSAAVVASFLNRYILKRHGAPKIFQNDQGREFCSEIVRECLEQAKTKHAISSPYHPMSNGLVERTNQTITGKIAKLTLEYKSDWDNHVYTAVFGYNITPQRLLGVSPYEALYGRQPRVRSEEPSNTINLEALHNDIRRRINEKKRQIGEDSTHLADPADLEPGTVVFLKNRTVTKTQREWFGPYYISKKGTKGCYFISTLDDAKTRQIHRDDIKPYIGGESFEDLIACIEDDEWSEGGAVLANRMTGTHPSWTD